VLTTHLLLAPRSRKSRAITLPHPGPSGLLRVPLPLLYRWVLATGASEIILGCVSSLLTWTRLNRVRTYINACNQCCDKLAYRDGVFSQIRYLYKWVVLKRPPSLYYDTGDSFDLCPILPTAGVGSGKPVQYSWSAPYPRRGKHPQRTRVRHTNHKTQPDKQFIFWTSYQPYRLVSKRQTNFSLKCAI
jgi:hypothetical protein